MAESTFDMRKMNCANMFQYICVKTKLQTFFEYPKASLENEMTEFSLQQKEAKQHMEVPY